MKAILLVAFLAACALATDFSQLKAIESTAFGKTLLDTVALELSSGEPLQHLFDTLYELEERYQADQKEDDQRNRQFQDVCDSDLQALNTEIANTERKSSELQDQLDALNPIKQQKVGQRSAKNAARAELQAVMDATTSQRAEENTDFEEKREEFEFVSSVLAQARRLFTENLQKPSFLQVNSNDAVHFTPQVMAEVGTHLHNSVNKINKMKHVKSYGKAIKLLATLTTRTQQQADQELVGRVVKLIDDLQNQLSQSFDLERKAEDQRVTAFNSYMTLLTKDMNKYNSQIANLDAEIASLTDRISAVTNSKSDVDQRLTDKTTQRDDRRAECEENAYDYQVRRQNRDNDKQTVSDLIGVINTNMRDLKEYIALRLAAGDNLA